MIQPPETGTARYVAQREREQPAQGLRIGHLLRASLEILLQMGVQFFAREPPLHKADLLRKGSAAHGVCGSVKL